MRISSRVLKNIEVIEEKYVGDALSSLKLSQNYELFVWIDRFNITENRSFFEKL